jgi:hypothetical protein
VSRAALGECPARSRPTTVKAHLCTECQRVAELLTMPTMRTSAIALQLSQGTCPRARNIAARVCGLLTACLVEPAWRRVAQVLEATATLQRHTASSCPTQRGNL